MKVFIRTICERLVFALSKFLHFCLIYLPINTYQPLYGRRDDNTQSTRACVDRWESIRPHLGDGKSVLDIGCNVGYFTFKAAEEGNVAIGVDLDIFYIATCSIIRESTQNSGAMFLKQKIDMDFINRMPCFDTVFNFSVFHHWVKLFGEEQSKDMMRGLASKCSVMFFETGQSNEADAKWSEKLHFMGDEPNQWIAAFLKEIGFTKVELIGTFPTGLTDVDRYLFKAQK